MQNEKYLIESIVTKYYNTPYAQEDTYERLIEVWYLGKKADLAYYQVMTVKSLFPDEKNMLNTLLRKIASTFNYLEIGVNEENRIAKVFNLSAIKLKWEKIQLSITTIHKGYEIENYCISITNLLEDEQSLIAFLNQKNVLGLLFNGHPKEEDKVIRKGEDLFEYRNGILIEFIINETNNNTNLKYSLLWLGSLEINDKNT